MIRVIWGFHPETPKYALGGWEVKTGLDHFCEQVTVPSLLYMTVGLRVHG